MKNENFKKRLALALVPILSLTSVIGNVPILPTSVFATTTDEESVVETVYSPNEEQDFYIVDPEKAGVPNTFEDIPVLAKDMLSDPVTYTVTWATPTNGSFTVTEGGTPKTNPYSYTEDTTAITVAFTPDAGYELDAFTIDGEAVEVTENTWTGTLAGKDVGEDDAIVLAATFKKIPDPPAPTTYEISWTITGAGTIAVNGDSSSPYPYVKDAALPEVVFTPDKGKVLTEFKVGGVNKLSNVVGGKYTFEAKPTEAVAITAKFEDIPTTYEISWTGVTGGTLKVGDATTSPYAYVKDADPPVVEFTADNGKVLTEFTVGGVNKLSKVLGGKYTFEAKPTKAVAITAKFETTVCKIGSVEFASLASAIAYINAQTSVTDYTIDILNNIPSLALTLPAATKAKSITLKTAKDDGDEDDPQPVPVDVAISNPTLAIPTALILDNVVLTSSGVNLTLSATASALTVKAGGGIEKVVNVSTAADKVITLEDTTKFAITGNLSGKPNITIKDDLVIAGTVAIGELTYAAAKKVSFTKAATATATITKIATIGDIAAVLEAGILSLTIGEIDVDTATTTGFIIKGRQYAVSTTDKTPVYKITGAISIATGKPIELSVYGKADTEYTSLAAIDPTTAIITSVKTETTAAMFKTSNKNADNVVYSFYKDGTSLKLGNTFVEVLDGVTSKENFIRLQDALDYINTNKADLTATVIKVSGDIPSHGALTFPEEDITIQSSDDIKRYKVLFTGAVKLNANLTLKNIELSNGNIKGIAFDLNGKNLTLDTDSKVILNNIVDTTKAVKTSELNIKDSGDLTFLGAIKAIGTVDIDDNTIFKGAVSNVVEIDIAAAKYAYFRGGAITNTLTYGTGSIINLPVNAKGGVTKNITIKDTTTGAITCTGTGKLEVNAVKDKLDVAVAATSTTPAVPEKITIETAAGASEKVNPGAVIVKLVKDSKVLASSFVTDAKNNKLTTDQTLIATKAGTAIKIAAPKLTATAPAVDPTQAFSENFVTIEEALAVVALDAVERDYTLTITDNIVGADLTNIPLNVAVITAAKPAEGKLPFKIVTAKDIGLNGDLTIENLNILAAAKTIGTVKTGAGENPTTSYKNAHHELVLENASLTVSEAYLDVLTLTGLDENDKIVGSSNVTFKKTGYIGYLTLYSGTTAGKIGSIPEESKLPEGS